MNDETHEHEGFGSNPSRRARAQPALASSLVAEFIGTAMLLATVVGSGIMASNLAGSNQAMALLGNTLPTGAILVVIILIFGPVSGAHFNPAVTLALTLAQRFDRRNVLQYVLVQLAGAVAGAWIAHLMFDLPLFQLSTTVRTGSGQWFAEVVATFGLVLTILGCLARAPASVPMAVGLYITAAYWFTASTSFANPAVTFARMLTDTYAGILPAHAPAFIAAQIVGAIAATAAASLVWPPASNAAADEPTAPLAPSA